MHCEKLYHQKEQTLEECLALIQPGDHIVSAASASEPTTLLSHLPEVIPDLHDVILMKGRDNEYDFLRDPNTKGHIDVV